MLLHRKVVYASGMQRMPAAFLGHGSPMNTLEENRFTSAWKAFGASVAPRPRAILVVSAHWFVNYTAVTAMERPRTIHDFFGFPQRLFDVQYPAPGDPKLAEEVAEIAKPTRVGLDVDGWGLDHGTWSVLVHAFPDADIPVVELSINLQKPLEWHVELGAKLAPLRERGVLVVASGNVVHNLRAIDWQNRDGGFDWAQRFDEKARRVFVETPADAPSLASDPDYERAVPTPDHFVPMLYIAGLGAAAGTKLSTFAEGYAYGSLSMTCYGLDVACPPRANEEPSARLPEGVPADETNA